LVDLKRNIGTFRATSVGIVNIIDAEISVLSGVTAGIVGQHEFYSSS
jgi:hypothetical protein